MMAFFLFCKLRKFFFCLFLLHHNFKIYQLQVFLTAGRFLFSVPFVCTWPTCSDRETGTFHSRGGIQTPRRWGTWTHTCWLGRRLCWTEWWRRLYKGRKNRWPFRQQEEAAPEESNVTIAGKCPRKDKCSPIRMRLTGPGWNRRWASGWALCTWIWGSFCLRGRQEIRHPVFCIPSFDRPGWRCKTPREPDTKLRNATSWNCTWALFSLSLALCWFGLYANLSRMERRINIKTGRTYLFSETSVCEDILKNKKLGDQLSVRGRRRTFEFAARFFQVLKYCFTGRHTWI